MDNRQDQHTPPEARSASFDAARATLAELSALALAGNERAFEALHRRVGAGLRRMLLKRVGGREDIAEDLCQKTWASVWKAISEGKYDPDRAAITTFVYAVGHNAWLTHLRQITRRQQLESSDAGSLDLASGGEASDAPPRDRTPTALLAEAEMIEAVRNCLTDHHPAPTGSPTLSSLERTIVHAIALGEGDRQLARRLGMSGSTINKHKHNAYAKVRAYLAKKGLIEVLPEAQNTQDGGHS